MEPAQGRALGLVRQSCTSNPCPCAGCLLVESGFALDITVGPCALVQLSHCHKGGQLLPRSPQDTGKPPREPLRLHQHPVSMAATTMAEVGGCWHLPPHKPSLWCLGPGSNISGGVPDSHPCLTSTSSCRPLRSPGCALESGVLAWTDLDCSGQSQKQPVSEKDSNSTKHTHRTRETPSGRAAPTSNALEQRACWKSESHASCSQLTAKLAIPSLFNCHVSLERKEV